MFVLQLSNRMKKAEALQNWKDRMMLKERRSQSLLPASVKMYIAAFPAKGSLQKFNFIRLVLHPHRTIAEKIWTYSAIYTAICKKGSELQKKLKQLIPFLMKFWLYIARSIPRQVFSSQSPPILFSRLSRWSISRSLLWNTCKDKIVTWWVTRFKQLYSIIITRSAVSHKLYKHINSFPTQNQ